MAGVAAAVGALQRNRKWILGLGRDELYHRSTVERLVGNGRLDRAAPSLLADD
jgi:hypothetical protein